jgi:hypothetical protein
MANDTVTSENLGEKMFEAAKISFGTRFVLIRHFLKDEAEKLSITLRMIIRAVQNGEMSSVEAKILMNQQKVACAAVLIAAEGMTAVAVQAAINAALGVVKDYVNGKAGFALL